MKRLMGLFLLMSLGACQPTITDPVALEEPAFSALVAAPERPLPIIGEINAVYDGQPVIWQTLDFSVGAIDPSANVSSLDGVTSLYLQGYLPNQDFREDFGRLRVVADLPNGASPGAAVNVEIAVIDTPGSDAPRYRSGPEALLQITQIVPPDLALTPYGPIAGTFVATLCRAESGDSAADASDCKPIAGEFETEGSFEALR